MTAGNVYNNSTFLPIRTPYGQHIGHVNFQDGLVHGVDGYVIGFWNSQPFHLTSTIDSCTGYALPAAQSFQATSAGSGLGFHPPNLVQPTAEPSINHWQTVASQPIIDANNSRKWDLHSNATQGNQGTLVIENTIQTAIPPSGWATPLGDVSMDSFLGSNVHGPMDFTQVKAFNSLGAFSSQVAEIHTGNFDDLGNMSFQPTSTEVGMFDNLIDMDMSSQPPVHSCQEHSSENQAAVSSHETTRGVAPFQCRHCNLPFKRLGDRTRHERTIHATNHGVFLCPIIGCPRNQGRGYSRADKVTEHLWKKHGNLGYVKGA